MTTPRVVLAPLLAVVCLAGSAAAQTPAGDTDAGAGRRVAFDTVIGYQDIFAEDAEWGTEYIVDAFAAIEVAPGWQVSIRPKLWRLRGSWEPLLDQASIRYEVRRGANWRFEAGRFPMPLGLGMTENRANINAGVLWWYRPYYMPIPSLGGDVPRVSLVSALYPHGASAAVSGDHWDARAAVVDRGPVEFWNPSGPVPHRANLVAGGGITPRQGLRLGVAGARGRYADATATREALDYTTLSAEGDVAIGYTRVSGEWTRSRFEAPGGTRASEGWTLQAQHTLTPRLFAHSRMTSMRSPRAASTAATRVDLQRFRSLDSTLGVLLTPELTLRGGHSAVRAFGRTVTDHQVGLSVIWSRRWW